jgi:hypothetical protein
MKKNWPILLGILVLILSYEVFVLRPYNMKLREAEQKQAELQEKLNALTAPKSAITAKDIFGPKRSPMSPKITAPIGLEKYPAAKTPKVSKS